MRGTFKGIEVKRRGGEQAHRRVGSLKLLQDFHFRYRALKPASAPFFCFPPRKHPTQLLVCHKTNSSWFAVRERHTSLRCSPVALSWLAICNS